MIKNLIIRPEEPKDYREAELITMRSFWNIHAPGCTEHLMIRVIRESRDYLPQFSRVAELDGRIVGAVYYTKAWVVDGDKKREFVTFGPLAVEPTMQGNGIGGALMRETIQLVKEAGIDGIIIAGEPNYYPRFGFKRCAEFGITDADGNSYDAYMCLPLNDDFSEVKGVFLESPDFEKLEDEKSLEEISKEFPKYRKVKVQDGFMMIMEQHLGVVEAFDGDDYEVRYWELLIPAKVSKVVTEKPMPGSDVQFAWNHKGEAIITKVFKNLLEE